MSKTTVIIIGLVVLGFGGLIAWSITNSQENSIDYDQYDPATIIEPTEDNGNIGDRVRGNPESPVVLIEYGDFQCSGCATAHPKIDTLVEEYGDRVAFVFRNFLLSYYQNSRAAAAAAESAGQQDYFFEMVSALYANQAIWSYASGSERTGLFIDLFQQIAPDGDVSQFRSDMSSSNISKKITFDSDLGLKRSQVTGTPSFYLNGEHIDMTSSSTTNDFLESMRSKIDAKLAEFDLAAGPTEDS